MTGTPREHRPLNGVGQQPLDLLGIGIGPFNLSLAALADRVPGLRSAFLERQPEFRWHPGLMIDGTFVQVPFLADLVSLVDLDEPLVVPQLPAGDRAAVPVLLRRAAAPAPG